ncbi:hypothetical protein [Pseudonocardia sp. TMWB2A]|uniref:hypothetical protein n=1 Tax=Pseudonocardia sp. TMWB2A TaxID=687430 RepID=UPI00307E3D57
MSVIVGEIIGIKGRGKFESHPFADGKLAPARGGLDAGKKLARDVNLNTGQAYHGPLLLNKGAWTQLAKGNSPILAHENMSRTFVCRRFLRLNAPHHSPATREIAASLFRE